MLSYLLFGLAASTAGGKFGPLVTANAQDVSQSVAGDTLVGYDYPVAGYTIPIAALTGPPPGEKDLKYLDNLKNQDTVDECAQVCDNKYWCKAFIFNGGADRHSRCNITMDIPPRDVWEPANSTAYIYFKKPVANPPPQPGFSGPNPGTLSGHNDVLIFFQYGQARDNEYTRDRLGGESDAVLRCAEMCKALPECMTFEITPLTGRCSMTNVTMPLNRTFADGKPAWKNDPRAFYYEWVGGEKPAPEVSTDPKGPYRGCFENNPDGTGLVLDFDDVVDDPEQVEWVTRNSSSAIDAPLWQAPPRGMTVDMCRGYCAQRGYAYAALRASFLCYCLQDAQLKILRPSPLLNCREECVGDRTPFCGGFTDYYSVYDASTGVVGQTFNISCVNKGYITGLGTGSSDGELPFVNVGCSYVPPGGERDNGVLDQRREPTRTIDINAKMLAEGASEVARRRAANGGAPARGDFPLDAYDVDVTHVGCDDDTGVAPVAVEVTVTNGLSGSKAIEALKFYCSSSFSDTHGLLDTRITEYSHTCPEGKFISAWVIFAERRLQDGHGRLAIQGICNDNTSLPVIGPNGPYMRVLRRLDKRDGRSVSLETQNQLLALPTGNTSGQSLPTGNITQEVIGGFEGIQNPFVPDLTEELSIPKTLTCASAYGRIAGLRAFTFKDDPAQMLHGLQATCANIICPAGTTGDGVNCDDINECATLTNQCDTNAVCINTNGSFECECNDGYEGPGNYDEDVATCIADSSKGLSTGAIVGLVVGIVALLVFCAVLLACMLRHTRSKEREFAAKLSRFERQSGWLDPLSPEARALLRAVQDRGGEVKPHEFTALDVIGQGNFGSVKRGVLLVKGDDGKDLATICAAKVLHQATPEHEQDFLMECERLKLLRHENIVGMLGMCNKDGSLHLLMEFCSMGNLHSYLRDMSKPGAKTPLNTLERMWLATQAADGLTYLHTKNIVHRDIAARNVLLDQAPHGLQVPSVDGRRLPVAKISDFGLARALSDGLYVASAGQELPVRWMAPEAIRFSQYSKATDVWSFAVLFWEIFEDGRMPLVREFPQNKDFLLAMVQCKPITHSRPSKCPEHVWASVETSFSEDPDARPRMAELLQNLGIALNSIATDSDTVVTTVPASHKLLDEAKMTGYVDTAMAGGLGAGDKTKGPGGRTGKDMMQPGLPERYEAIDVDHSTGDTSEYTEVLAHEVLAHEEPVEYTYHEYMQILSSRPGTPTDQ